MARIAASQILAPPELLRQLVLASFLAGARMLLFAGRLGSLHSDPTLRPQRLHVPRQPDSFSTIRWADGHAGPLSEWVSQHPSRRLGTSLILKVSVFPTAHRPPKGEGLLPEDTGAFFPSRWRRPPPAAFTLSILLERYRTKGDSGRVDVLASGSSAFPAWRRRSTGSTPRVYTSAGGRAALSPRTF